MRKEIYRTLCKKLKGIPECDIQHIDLWNRNVEFIEQEDGWSRPAVFIEFGQIEWNPVVGNRIIRGDGTIKLHIVTDWKGGTADGSEFQEESLAVFDFSQKIYEAINGLSGSHYSSFTLSQSHTNHDHEDIVETIEVYKFKCTMER